MLLSGLSSRARGRPRCSGSRLGPGSCRAEHTTLPRRSKTLLRVQRQHAMLTCALAWHVSFVFGALRGIYSSKWSATSTSTDLKASLVHSTLQWPCCLGGSGEQGYVILPPKVRASRRFCCPAASQAVRWWFDQFQDFNQVILMARSNAGQGGCYSLASLHVPSS